MEYNFQIVAHKPVLSNCKTFRGHGFARLQISSSTCVHSYFGQFITTKHHYGPEIELKRNE